MPTTLTVNGVGYSYPNTGDQQWGSAASAWALAVTNGMLQKAGGNFTLTADANFGGTYGLISSYFTSRTANAATAGAVRLANTDSVSWRNAANNANIALSVDASNRLTYAGVVLASSAGVVPVTAGGTGLTAGTSGGVPYFSASTTMASSAALAQYGVVLGGGAGAAPATLAPNASTAFPLVSGGASANPLWALLTVAGGGTGLSAGTSGGVPYFSSTSAMTSSALLAQYGLMVGGGAGAAPATIAPDASTTKVLVSGGASANPAWGTVAAGAMPALTGDVTTSAGAVATTAAATQANIQTLSRAAGVAVHGTNTNDAASAGYIGEYTSSTISTPTNFPTSGQFGDLTSISLTAGDWEICGMVYGTPNGATVTRMDGAITTTSGNSTTGVTFGDTAFQTPGSSLSSDYTGAIAPFRVSLSGTTTYYLKYRAVFTVATPQGQGRISARRFR